MYIYNSLDILTMINCCTDTGLYLSGELETSINASLAYFLLSLQQERSWTISQLSTLY